MKTIETFCVVMLISVSLFSQGLSKKEIKHQADSIEFSNIQQLIDTRNYEFSVHQILPLGGQSIVTTSNEYSVVVKNDSVYSDLPFYGRAYRVNLSDRGGFFFSEPLTGYVTKCDTRKKTIQINFNVKSPDDDIRFNLTVTGKENASLSVISNNRSGISYWGEVKNIHEDNKK